LQADLTPFEANISNQSALFSLDEATINKVVNISLISYQDLYMRTEILILNENYLSHKYFFFDIAT